MSNKEQTTLTETEFINQLKIMMVPDKFKATALAYLQHSKDQNSLNEILVNGMVTALIEGDQMVITSNKDVKHYEAVGYDLEVSADEEKTTIKLIKTNHFEV